MSTMLGRKVVTSTMFPYQSANPPSFRYEYNQTGIMYNEHIEYDYAVFSGLMFNRVISGPTMEGRN